MKIFRSTNNNLSLYSFVYVREIRAIDNSRGLCAILRSHCPRIRSGDFISAAIETTEMHARNLFDHKLDISLVCLNTLRLRWNIGCLAMRWDWEEKFFKERSIWIFSPSFFLLIKITSINFKVKYAMIEIFFNWMNKKFQNLC